MTINDENLSFSLDLKKGGVHTYMKAKKIPVAPRSIPQAQVAGIILVENSHRDIVLLRVYKGLLAWIINQQNKDGIPNPHLDRSTTK